MFIRSTITTLAALVALAGVADAGAATRTMSGQTTTIKAQTAQPTRMTKVQGTGPVHPVTTTGPTVMAISANPTGGKGSGTEATCDLWTNQLQQDESAVGEATETSDKIDAVNGLNADIDNAMDAGCFVIYSMVKPQPKGPATIKTVSMARLATGGYTATTWTAAPTVMKISAYPTGGKGSGTEATCKLWTKQLQQDQEIVNSAPETDQQDAEEALTDKDVDNALDAGCFVIY